MPYTPMSRTEAIAAIRARLNLYSRRASSGCLEWTASVDNYTGYGRISVPQIVIPEISHSGHRSVTAAAAACWLEHGPRPLGMQVLHSCDNRPCIEGSHLRWGTRAENMREAQQRGHTGKGQTHPSARLPDAVVREIVGRAEAGTPVPQLAAEYDTSARQVYTWLRGEGRGAGIATGKAPTRRRPAHCVNGHPFTEENTYIRRDDGTRKCRVCARERTRRNRLNRSPR